jgi:hypothetical protein
LRVMYCGNCIRDDTVFLGAKSSMSGKKSFPINPLSVFFSLSAKQVFRFSNLETSKRGFRHTYCLINSHAIFYEKMKDRISDHEWR